MNKDTFPKVKVIMNKSIDEAKSFDDVTVRPEHIVLSILVDGENECVKVFKRLNVDIKHLCEVISDFIRKDISKPPITKTSIHNKKPQMSEDTKMILRLLDKECDKLNDDIIDTTHIMLAILSSRLKITEILAKEKINYSNFFKNMVDFKNSLFENSINDDDDDSPKKKNKQGYVKSKTPVLDNFCVDISKAVERGEIDPVIGRSKEIKRVSQILSRRVKHNCIIIGEPGTGKSAIVEALALLIHNGNAPRTLIGKKIFSLDVASIVAGTKYRGQFEERMKAIIDECKANQDVLLFIDEIHTIVGAGNSSGSLDASNILKPALARGELQIIGATTLKEYRENFEKDGALTRRFQEVLLQQTTIEETKTILMNIKHKYEKHHNVIYTNEAIEQCVKLSDRYITDKSMPDKAIDVLDEAGATTNVVMEKPESIKILEDKKNKIIEKKKEVVTKQKYEEAAKLRDEEKKIVEALENETKEWKNSLKNNITKIDADLIFEVISNMTGIPISKISTEEGKRLMNMEKDFSSKIIGQELAVSKIVKAIKRSSAGIKDKSKPLVLMFLGKTGTGKSLLSKLLAEYMFGDKEALIRFDMSEYMEKHSTSKLIGTNPGYIGYEEGGQLTEKIRKKPYSIILFDEIEKANDDVFNLFLQLFDEGHLTDGLGRKVNFKNTIIIMTSNIGVKEISDMGKNVGFRSQSNIISQDNKSNDIIKKALRKRFKPEFLNRISETIIFNDLKQDDINKIVSLELKKLEDRVNEVKIKIKFSKDVVDFIGKKGYDEEYGARPINRAIQEYLEDRISDEILSDNIKEGETISVTYDKEKDDIVLKTIKTKK